MLIALSWAVGPGASAGHGQRATPGDTSLLVRLESARPQALAASLARSGFDLDHVDPGRDSLELIVLPAEYERLVSAGLQPIVLEHGRPFTEVAAERGEPVRALGDDTPGHDSPGDGSPPGGYATLAQIEADMAAVAAAHPAICELVDLTARYGTPPTFEGRHLLALKISDNVGDDEDEPAAIVVSAHHCRELITPVIALHAVERLTDDYGTDPQVTAVVDEYEIWIAPLWNPDGYNHVFTGDHLWRKNRRPLSFAVGVDLNRNYPFGWDAVACDGSTIESSQTYKGPFALSEAETQTMVALAADRHVTKVLDYHSSGQEVLWGYACSTHPLAGFLEAEGIALSVASGYGGDERPPSAEGEHYQWELANLGSHAFLIETTTEFQPPFSTAESEAALLWPGILWMLERPIPLSGHVTDACTNLPLAADIALPTVNYVHGESNRSGGPFGRYQAFLPSGVYDVEFSAPGYVTQTHPLIVVDTSAATFDVALVPVTPDSGCWTDLGAGLAGAHGTPRLAGSGELLPASANRLLLDDAAPLAPAWLITGAPMTPLPFKGGTLVPTPTFVVQTAIDAEGRIDISFELPGGLPAGTEFHVQYWISDPAGPVGFAASNAVSAVTG